MIRFLLKTSFLIGLAAFFLSGSDSTGEGEAESIDLVRSVTGAQQAIADVAGFCGRAPAACAAGGDLAAFAGARIADGLSRLGGLAGARIGDGEHQDEVLTEPGPSEAPASSARFARLASTIDPALLQRLVALDLDDPALSAARDALAASPSVSSGSGSGGNRLPPPWVALIAGADGARAGRIKKPDDLPSVRQPRAAIDSMDRDLRDLPRLGPLPNRRPES